MSYGHNSAGSVAGASIQGCALIQSNLCSTHGMAFEQWYQLFLGHPLAVYHQAFLKINPTCMDTSINLINWYQSTFKYINLLLLVYFGGKAVLIQAYVGPEGSRNWVSQHFSSVVSGGKFPSPDLTFWHTNERVFHFQFTTRNVTIVAQVSNLF